MRSPPRRGTGGPDTRDAAGTGQYESCIWNRASARLTSATEQRLRTEAARRRSTARSAGRNDARTARPGDACGHARKRSRSAPRMEARCPHRRDEGTERRDGGARRSAAGSDVGRVLARHRPDVIGDAEPSGRDGRHASIKKNATLSRGVFSSCPTAKFGRVRSLSSRRPFQQRPCPRNFIFPVQLVTESMAELSSTIVNKLDNARVGSAQPKFTITCRATV